MNIISHSSKINLLSESPLKDHIQARFDQLSEDTDIPPVILLLHRNDIPRSSELSFLGSEGMCSDLFETHQPGDLEFTPVGDDAKLVEGDAEAEVRGFGVGGLLSTTKQPVSNYF